MDGFLSFLKNVTPEWHKPGALVGAVGATWGSVSLLLSHISPRWWVFPVTWALSGACVIFAWWLARRPPRTRPGQIGIVIALAAEDEVSNRTRIDFVDALRSYLEASAVSAAFQVMEVQEWRARELNCNEAAVQLRDACRAHFLFFGGVRRRMEKGVETPIISLRGLVSHAPLPQSHGQHLQQEFTKVLPHKVLLDANNQLVTTEFTSRWAGVVAKYVIALAAAMSGDPDYSEGLLLEVQAALPPKDSPFQVFNHIRGEIPKWLTQIYVTKTKYLYASWLSSRDHGTMCALRDVVDRVRKHGCDQTAFLSMMAMCAFVLDRDVKKAMGYLQQSLRLNNPVTLVNLGFLHAYSGNLKKSCDFYRRAMAEGLAAPAIVGEVETFQDWVLQIEPERFQLHFSLGFLNFHLKGDTEQAARDFKEFIDRCPSAKYGKEKGLIFGWMPNLLPAPTIDSRANDG